MKKLIFTLSIGAIASLGAWAQGQYDLAENDPVIVNGIEYGFNIRNERKKEVKDEEYNRFEITVYTTNKSGCTKLMFPKQTLFGLENQNKLADFDCLNATGKRLTSKTASISAKPFYAPYTTTIKGSDGKDVSNTVSVQVGHAFRNGESLTSNFIVIVPQGERPNFKVRVRELFD